MARRGLDDAAPPWALAMAEPVAEPVAEPGPLAGIAQVVVPAPLRSQGQGGGPAAAGRRRGRLRRVEDLDTLVPVWLTFPEVAERLGLDVTRVRRLVQDRYLVAARRGERRVWSVPEELLVGNEPMQDLRGTLTVLADSGYDAEASLRWLFTADASLPGTPIDALRAGRKTEVRRRAQALAF